MTQITICHILIPCIIHTAKTFFKWIGNRSSPFRREGVSPPTALSAGVWATWNTGSGFSSLTVRVIVRFRGSGEVHPLLFFCCSYFLQLCQRLEMQLDASRTCATKLCECGGVGA